MSAGPKLEERRAAQHARLQCELKSCSRFGGFFFFNFQVKYLQRHLVSTKCLCKYFTFVMFKLIKWFCLFHRTGHEQRGFFVWLALALVSSSLIKLTLKIVKEKNKMPGTFKYVYRNRMNAQVCDQRGKKIDSFSATPPLFLDACFKSYNMCQCVEECSSRLTHRKWMWAGPGKLFAVSAQKQ